MLVSRSLSWSQSLVIAPIATTPHSVCVSHITSIVSSLPPRYGSRHFCWLFGLFGLSNLLSYRLHSAKPIIQRLQRHLRSLSLGWPSPRHSINPGSQPSFVSRCFRLDCSYSTAMRPPWAGLAPPYVLMNAYDPFNPHIQRLIFPQALTPVFTRGELQYLVVSRRRLWAWSVNPSDWFFSLFFASQYPIFTSS